VLKHLGALADAKKELEGKIYFPKIVNQEKEKWRELSFETYTLSQIDLESINNNEF